MDDRIKTGQVADGLVRYVLNGNENAAIEFNPADPLFMGRLFDAFTRLDEVEERRKAAMQGVENGAVFGLLTQYEAEMRGVLDETLGEGLCGELFPRVSVYALADGLPVWQNLLLSIMDKMDETVVAEQKKTNPRIEKYTKRYQKYQKG